MPTTIIQRLTATMLQLFGQARILLPGLEMLQVRLLSRLFLTTRIATRVS